MALTLKEAEKRLEAITGELTGGVRELMRDMVDVPQEYVLNTKHYWSGKHRGNDPPVGIQPVTITFLNTPTAMCQVVTENGVYYGVDFGELSPLPDMYVGKVWSLEQDGNPWDGRLVKCVRDNNDDLGKYEQWLLRSGRWVHCNDTAGSIIETGFMGKHFIIRCIDPEFWTGVIEGERIRIYHDKDDDIRIYPEKSPSFNVQKSDRLLQYKVWLSAIERGGIPTMPYAQSNGNYESPTEAPH